MKQETTKLKCLRNRLARHAHDHDALEKRRAKLAEAHGQLEVRFNHSTARLDSLDRKAVKNRAALETHIGAVDGELAEIERRITVVDKALQETIAQTAEEYGRVLSGRVDKLITRIAAQLSCWFKAESLRPEVVASGCDAVAYLRDHLRMNWASIRSDHAAGMWLVDRCDALLASPAAVPWPPPPCLPAPPQAEAMEAVAA